jgi:hypothetical protein
MKVRAPCEEARSWAGSRWKEGGLLLDPKLEPFTDRSSDCSSATSPSFSPFSSCHKKEGVYFSLRSKRQNKAGLVTRTQSLNT